MSKYYTVVGYDELVKSMKRLPGAALEASAVGQYNAGQATMVLSKTRAPYEHGDLEKAAFVEFPRITSFAATVELGYFGIPYIYRQHETREYEHAGTKTTTKNRGRADQGQWKFLESAVRDTETSTNKIIAAAIDYFIRTGRLPAMKGSIKGRQ